MNPTEEKALLDEIKKLTDRVAALETTVDTVKKGAEMQMANRRTRYQEVGQWARHYSTVRMTVTTFLLGLCVTIVSFGWNYWDTYPRKSSIYIAGTLWIIAVTLFTVFTRLSMRMGRNAIAHRNNLLVGSEGNARASNLDPASLALAVICLGFAWVVKWTNGWSWALGFIGALAAVVIGGFLLTNKKS